MHKLISKSLVILLYSLIELIIPQSVFGGTEFNTTFTSTYNVLSSGVTEVHHQVKIKNNLAHIYTTDYSIMIGENNLTNINVLSEGKIAPHQVNNSENTTTLEITIPNPVVGKDQETNLDIYYDSENIAEHAGKIWEINIPKLTKANEAESYTRKIIVPNSLITASIEYPLPTKIEKDEANSTTTYYYMGYPTEGITLLFGSSQIYELNLSYNINNPTPNSTNTEIALPLDTGYQHVTIASLDPEPIEITLDEDQNWLAIYTLKPNQNLTVNASVFVELYPQPTINLTFPNSKNLTSSQTYWEVNNPTIDSLATKLKTPQNIYNYLLDNFSYNYARVGVGAERLGAIQALTSPSSAICTEFTDTFIALARAQDIYAREINGYAYTTNTVLRPLELATDVLHAWPEYYDEGSASWLQIDPTWGETTGGIDYFSKMDFNHIAFVRHGAESTYPYPPGAYKSDSREKTVNVKLADSLPASVTTYSLTSSGDKNIVTNTGNVALHNFPVTLKDGSTHEISYLPPFGKETILPELPPKLSIFTRIINLIRKIFAL